MSSLPSTDVALMIGRAVIDAKDFPEISLGVKNHGSVSVDLTPDAVRVTTNLFEELPLITHDELVSMVEANYRKQAKRAAFAAKLDALGAALRDQPTNPNPYVQAGPREVAEETEAIMDSVRDRGFLAETVRVGEEHKTDLGLPPLPPGVTSLTVQVTLGSETHRVLLNVAR